ncbi:MAG: chloride channel protein [Pseudomonadota bacterium]
MATDRIDPIAPRDAGPTAEPGAGAPTAGLDGVPGTTGAVGGDANLTADTATASAQARPRPRKRILGPWTPPFDASPVFELLNARIGPNWRSFFAERQLLVWTLALAIGVGVGYAAILFRMLIGLFQYPWLGTTTERVITAAANVPWIIILLAPVCGGLIVGYFLQFHVPGRRAHGVADVIEARALNDCKIPVTIGLWSAFLATLSLGFGASGGREGPMVHLGATIASALEDRFHLEPGARRTLLACGVAAAVSGSFNAPLAGVLFAHEVILAHYALRAFVPIVLASVCAAVISRVHFGDVVAFVIPQYQITTYWEFPAFALLGLTCAVVAITFEATLMATERASWRIDVPLWVRPAIGGLCVGIIALAFPHVLGVGYEATDRALYQQFPLWMLLALIVAKTAATAVTLASRFAGGIFSPSIYLGAMAGGAFGIIASSVFPEMSSSHGLYAILGMGGVAAAVLGAPFSTTLVVFELTGGFELSIALLVTVSISNGLTQAVLGYNFFHWQLAKRGLSLQDGPHQEIMRRLLVRNFMREIDPSQTHEDEDLTLRDDEAPRLHARDTLETALRVFDTHGLTRIPVVSAADETRIIAWAERLSALSAYNKALIDSHVEEHR